MMTVSRVQRFALLAAFAVFSLLLLNWRTSHYSKQPSDISGIPVDSGHVNANARPQFLPGKAKPPGETYTKTIVMAKMKYNHVDWVYDLEGVNATIYHVDDPTAALKVPKNKGHEAMAYLTYIIDNYDMLPDIVLFFHAHKQAWHNNILLDLDSAKTIKHMNPAHVMRQGYFNSRCHHDPGCPDWIHLDRPADQYDMIKKPEEPDFTEKVWREVHPNEPIPHAISQPCCAQFAVSGERIRQRALSDYIHYRDWILNTKLIDEVSGRVFEYSWQLIFGGETEYCPSQHQCYCDGYGVCFGSTNDDGLNGWLKVLQQQEKLESEIDELKENPEKNQSKIDQLMDTRSGIVDRLNRMKDEAYRRGEDPKNRAEECGRPWQEGDGF